MIHFACPSCGKDFQVKDEFAGRRTKCPKCGQAIEVPATKTVAIKQPGPPAVDPPPRPVGPSAPRAVVIPEVLQRRPMDEYQECPFCGELVLAKAKKCKHCGETLDVVLRSGEPRAAGASVGMAVAGMVLGILALVFGFIPCFGWVFGILLGILGTIFSGVGLGQASKAGHGKGMAVTGLVLSILAIIWAPLFYFLVLAALAGAGAGLR